MGSSLHLLDSAHINDVLNDLAREANQKKEKPERWCCAVCKAFITDDACIVRVNGAHEHYKVNPQGHAFHFRSYKHAQGCLRVGQATAEYSWFSGCIWQFAHCANCHTQLGWYFAGSESFFGLIAGQIVRCVDQ